MAVGCPGWERLSLGLGDLRVLPPGLSLRPRHLLSDMIRRRSLRTRAIKMLVLDEADEMLNKGRGSCPLLFLFRFHLGPWLAVLGGHVCGVLESGGVASKADVLPAVLLLQPFLNFTDLA